MIKSVTPLEIKPNPDAIETLESVLERVRSGELASIGVSWVTKDGAIGGSVSASNNMISMWASLEHNAKNFYTNILMEE